MQCHQFKLLVQSDGFRFAGYCEHDTVHIAWDCLMLHLRTHDFRRVVRLLEEGVTELNFRVIRDGNHCALVPQENGFYQLWCGDIMLLLDSMDFLNFVDLARTAARQIN